MKILYFYQYFSTSEGSWGTRVHEFARNWVREGHEVTVVTSIYSKSDLRSSSLVSDKVVDGIKVKIINVLIDNRQPVIKRIFTFLQYAFISCWFALRLKADVVIASSGPITVGIPGLIARWLRGRKLIFEARDLWPEGAVRMGVLRNKMAIRLAYSFERLCYRNSTCIVGLSPGIEQDIKKRFPDCWVENVTNAANISLFSTPQNGADHSKGKSYAIYFGNIGQVNHSGFLLDCAKLLLQSGRGEIRIVFIGEGQLKEQLQERVKREELTNVEFLDLMPKSKLVSYVQHSLASLIPLKPIPVFDTSSPNKLFESMAAGVPVIQTTQGWIKDFLEREGGGFTVDGNDPRALADLLITLKDDPELATSTGRRASATAKKYFDKDHLAGKMLTILIKVHEGR